MTVGMVILMASFLLLDQATSVSQEVANRHEALQRGRLAMETIVRDLRSQVCLGDETEPITVADDNMVTFYIDLSDGSKDVEQRTIRYEPDTKQIFEDIYIGSGVYPLLMFDQPSPRRECSPRTSSRSSTTACPVRSSATTRSGPAACPETSSCSPLRSLPTTPSAR